MGSQQPRADIPPLRKRIACWVSSSRLYENNIETPYFYLSIYVTGGEGYLLIIMHEVAEIRAYDPTTRQIRYFDDNTCTLYKSILFLRLPKRRG